ncbi:hypothetical protein CONPUDRAFT_169791 [Coniophora puteana RWD-64-598 SS2]|uniref:EF-hand domain-containing protein n=1 Tax=Coniophora puteana (strain RWD-64-598) TaxID=741705 RepID=A0A5M3M6X4_CONPW|nr:uncharacterized protein CONPUDRAFT_169791 [Coniophora puteana RWD-64-598 SS2]EIW74857.1 hypothetical protein CONPUDRAFT_169791 [Coniophora puteana RWD-64-598 SS2]
MMAAQPEESQLPSPDNTIRERLRSVLIPAAKQALQDAQSDIGKIEKTEVPPPQLKEVAKRIISAGNKVVVVVQDVSALYQIGQDAALFYASLTKIESDRKEPANQQIAIIYYLISSVIFAMRHLDRSTPFSPAQRSELDRLLVEFKNTMEDFGQYADLCYKKGSFLAVLRGTELRGRIKKYWDDLMQHRISLTEYIAIEFTYEVNIKEILNQVGHATDRERLATRFVADNRGPEAVLRNPELLSQLSMILGETITDSLRRSLTGDVAEMMEQNRNHFNIKLRGSTARIRKAITSSREAILKRLDAGPHELIIDDDIKAIWKENKWRMSVKARTFMDGIHNYFEPHVRRKILVAAINKVGIQGDTPVETSSGEDDIFQSEEWTLPFLSNAMYSPAVVDAMDGDGSGFISVDECNDFLQRRPPRWSVPQWFSFWAIVWLMNNEHYLDKINEHIAAIKKAAKVTQPGNKIPIRASEYMKWLDFLDPVILQSLNWGITQNTPSSIAYGDLYRVQEAYTKYEEGKIDEELKHIEYAVDDVEALPYITGHDRIELIIMPLLYLILSYQRTIMEQASREVVDGSVFGKFKDALNTVLLAFNSRLNDLERGWKQMRKDVNAQVECFAGGMFYAWQQNRRSSSKSKAAKPLLDFWANNNVYTNRYEEDGSEWWNVFSPTSPTPQGLTRPVASGRGSSFSRFSAFPFPRLTHVQPAQGDPQSDRIAALEERMERVEDLLDSIDQKLTRIQASAARFSYMAGKRGKLVKHRRSRGREESYQGSVNSDSHGCVIS